MKLLSILLVVFGMSAAHAEDGFDLGFGLYRAGNQTTGDVLGETDVTDTSFDVKFGHTWGEFYSGVIYSSLTSTFSDGTTTTTVHNRTGYGLTVGYHNSGFVADLHYMPMMTDALAGNAELTGGSGIGVDLGYNMDLSRAFYMGFQYVYRSFSFENVKVGEASVAEKNTWVQMYPQISLGFKF